MKKIILSTIILAMINQSAFAAFGGGRSSSSSSARSSSVSSSRVVSVPSKPSSNSNSFASNKSVGLQRNIPVNNKPQQINTPVPTSNNNYTSNTNNNFNNRPYNNSNYAPYYNRTTNQNSCASNELRDNQGRCIKDNSTRNAIAAGVVGLTAGALATHALSKGNDTIPQPSVTPNVEPLQQW
jgi:hypothetical protein